MHGAVSCWLCPAAPAECSRVWLALPEAHPDFPLTCSPCPFLFRKGSSPEDVPHAGILYQILGSKAQALERTSAMLALFPAP